MNAIFVPNLVFALIFWLFVGFICGCLIVEGDLVYKNLELVHELHKLVLGGGCGLTQCYFGFIGLDDFRLLYLSVRNTELVF